MIPVSVFSIVRASSVECSTDRRTRSSQARYWSRGNHLGRLSFSSSRMRYGACVISRACFRDLSRSGILSFSIANTSGM